MTDAALSAFSAPTRGWFEGVFAGPTAVQAEAWAAIARGENALVVAPTGSGKTLAFGLPMLTRVAQGSPVGSPRAVILSPTRELALQIADFALGD